MGSIYKDFEKLFQEKIKKTCEEHPDPSHDFLHVLRVVRTAKECAHSEKANLDIVVPAAYLHDCVLVSKNDPRRKEASRLSAEMAVLFLKEIHYPNEFHPAIYHAIHAHSFSAGVHAETIEAQVVQDADRLDGIGAIGIARCFCLSGLLKRDLYFPEDPFCEKRIPQDHQNSLDHFFVKLLKVPQMLKTESGKKEGMRRLKVMQDYIEGLKQEINTV